MLRRNYTQRGKLARRRKKVANSSLTVSIYSRMSDAESSEIVEKLTNRKKITRKNRQNKITRKRQNLVIMKKLKKHAKKNYQKKETKKMKCVHAKHPK